MKVAILAGGEGKRLAEETSVRPKPLVEIGGRPILWHIMMHYAYYGFTDFIVAAGYKIEKLKQYFLEQRTQMHGDCARNPADLEKQSRDTTWPWNIELVDTGDKTETGGRMKRLAPLLGNKPFMLTWSDGLSNVDLNKLLAFHRHHGKLATVTAVHPPSRFGHLELKGGQVIQYSEKPPLTETWINGAFFVLEPKVLDYIEGDKTIWEKEPLEKLAKEGQLMAYRHPSFWQCMDTLRDKDILEKLWKSDHAPWKVWD